MPPVRLSELLHLGLYAVRVGDIFYLNLDAPCTGYPRAGARTRQLRQTGHGSRTNTGRQRRDLPRRMIGVGRKAHWDGVVCGAPLAPPVLALREG